MEALLALLIILLLPCLGTVFYCWYRLRKELQVHVTPNTKERSKYPLPYKSCSFKAKDGVLLAAWYLPVKDAKAVVILVHGRKITEGGKSLMLAHARYLRESGYTTLLVDLRSNDESPGHRVTLGVKEWRDVEAAYDYVKTLAENKKKKIGFFGISMGAATSIIAAGKSGKGDFLIASVPYASYERLFDWRIRGERLPKALFKIPVLIAARLVLGWDYNDYSPINFISKIKVPILLFSAKKDEEVDPNDAKLLFEAANEPKLFWQADTKHDIFKSQERAFKRGVLNFLKRYAK